MMQLSSQRVVQVCMQSWSRQWPRPGRPLGTLDRRNRSNIYFSWGFVFRLYPRHTSEMLDHPLRDTRLRCQTSRSSDLALPPTGSSWTELFSLRYRQIISLPPQKRPKLDDQLLTAPKSGFQGMRRDATSHAAEYSAGPGDLVLSQEMNLGFGFRAYAMDKQA